jgi:hypothetical protein
MSELGVPGIEVLMKSSLDCFVTAVLLGYALLAMTVFDVGLVFLGLRC